MTETTETQHATTQHATTKHAATKDPKATYPKTLFQAAGPDGSVRPVTVTDEASEKALRPPGFPTLTEAVDYAAPLEQPIPHIERTNNEEQFDPVKSRAGQPIPSGVVRTPPPVQNVFVQTGVETDTMHLTAVLPEGMDPAALKPPGQDPQAPVVLTSASAPGQMAHPVAHGDAKKPDGEKPQQLSHDPLKKP